MNSNEIKFLYTKIEHAREVAKASRISLYGLHHSVNWNNLHFKELAIQAIELSLENPTAYFALTDEEIEIMLSKIGNYSAIASSKKSCCN